MPSVGESLLEIMNSETPETVPDTPVVETTQEVSEDKPRRQRKPKAELATTPEATDAPAETVTDASPEPVVPEQPAWLKRVESELGFQNVTDETEARDRLLDYAVREKAERQRLEEDYQRKIRDLEYRSVAAASQPQTTPEPERKPWQPPVEYPAAASRYLTRKEDGTPDWKSDTPADVRAQTEKWVAWRDDIREMMLERPDEFLGKVLPQLIAEHAKGIVEPFYEERTAEQERVAYFRQFEQQNAAWLFAKDPQTGRASNQLSQVGSLLNQRLGVHLERGCSYDEAISYAQYDVQRETGQSPWAAQAAPTPDQVRAQNKQNTLRKPLNGAGSVAPRTGSFTEPESSRPQNGHLRAGELLRQAMAEGAV